MTNLELQEPQAKVLYYGTSALSDAETIGLIMAGVNPTDKANELLKAVDYNFADLGQYNYDALKNTFSLSHLQAIRLIAVFEFAHRKAIQTRPEKKQIRCSKDIYDTLYPYIGELGHEEFYAIYLSRSNKIIKMQKLSQGGLSGTVTDVRMIMHYAILCKCSGLIVSHNHPSGNMNPSESDTKITQKIKEAGALLDIQLLDHIILCGKDFYSFADSGII